MTIALDNSLAITSGTSPKTQSFTVAVNANRLLIVRISFPGDGSVTSITYNSVALTLVDTASSGTGATNRKSAIYYLIAPATGTNDVVLTVATDAVMAVEISSWYGVDQSTPLGTSAKTSATTGTSFSVAPGSAVGDVVIDAGCIRTTSTPSATGGQTVDENQVLNGNVRGVGGHLAGSAGTTTMSWSWTGSDNNALIAVAIKPAPAGMSINTALIKLTSNINLGQQYQETVSPILKKVTANIQLAPPISTDPNEVWIESWPEQDP